MLPGPTLIRRHRRTGRDSHASPGTPTLSICSDGPVLSNGSVSLTLSIVSIGSRASTGLSPQRQQAARRCRPDEPGTGLRPAGAACLSAVDRAAGHPLVRRSRRHLACRRNAWVWVRARTAAALNLARHAMPAAGNRHQDQPAPELRRHASTPPLPAKWYAAPAAEERNRMPSAMPRTERPDRRFRAPWLSRRSKAARAQINHSGAASATRPLLSFSLPWDGTNILRPASLPSFRHTFGIRSDDFPDSRRSYRA